MPILQVLLSPKRHILMRALGASVALCAGGSASAAPLDVTPPALTSFSVTGSVDAAKTGQFVTLNFTATDNLSGVFVYYVTLESPNGVKINQVGLLSPTKTAAVVAEVGYGRYTNIEFGGQFDRWSQPGTWSVSSFDVRDLAGNAKVYDKAALAAFGNTEFTVTNTQSDSVAPKLVSGNILTPTLSLSKPPAGLPAGAPPLGKTSLKVYDRGTGAVSGIDTVSVFFCKEPFDPATNECVEGFGLTGLLGVPVRAATQNVLVASQVRGKDGVPITPGVFRLWAIGLNEVAGNNVGYTDVRYGGETDFSALFPAGTTITVTP